MLVTTVLIEVVVEAAVVVVRVVVCGLTVVVVVVGVDTAGEAVVLMIVFGFVGPINLLSKLGALNESSSSYGDSSLMTTGGSVVTGFWMFNFTFVEAVFFTSASLGSSEGL